MRSSAAQQLTPTSKHERITERSTGDQRTARRAYQGHPAPRPQRRALGRSARRAVREMTTRWEVEAAINASNVEPTGRHLVLWFLTLSVAATAEIPPPYAPTYTAMEEGTGLSRSALTEWMKALVDGKWISRATFAGESRPGFRLMIGDPNAARAPRKANKQGTKNADGAYRQAVRPAPTLMPPSGTTHTAERYADVPPGDTAAGSHLLKDSPTESPTPNTTPDPAPAAGRAAPKKRTTKAPKTEEPREDVDRICTYLAEWIVRNGSRRPSITKEWRDEARRLIDRDGRPLDEIQKVIRWSQRDQFWRKNVLSMPTFRKQYDRLRLGWEDDPDNKKRGDGRTQGGYEPYRNFDDDAYLEWINR